jgi:hypothetical protein
LLIKLKILPAAEPTLALAADLICVPGKAGNTPLHPALL